MHGYVAASRDELTAAFDSMNAKHHLISGTLLTEITDLRCCNSHS